LIHTGILSGCCRKRRSALPPIELGRYPCCHSSHRTPARLIRQRRRRTTEYMLNTDRAAKTALFFYARLTFTTLTFFYARLTLTSQMKNLSTECNKSLIDITIYKPSGPDGPLQLHMDIADVSKIQGGCFHLIVQ